MKNRIYSAIMVFGFLFLGSYAEASTLVFFNSNALHMYTGDTTTVDLLVSADKSINVIDGTLTYDKDKIEIKNVTIDGSIASLWTMTPVFDNKKGQLTFVGGIPNGFTGHNGQVLKITFLAKREGETKFNFQDIFSIFLNDGLGTSINPWLEPISISIVQKPMKLVLQESLQTFTNGVKNPNNLGIILLFVILILGIILTRLKRVHKK